MTTASHDAFAIPFSKSEVEVEFSWGATPPQGWN